MNPAKQLSSRIFVVVLLLGSQSGCGQSPDTVQVGGTRMPAQPVAGTAVVFGTVFDLKTGEPAADVEIVLPGNKRSHTDAEGRFLVPGLAQGSFGEAIARAGDGREARLALPALGNERREIVLHLPAR